jgi:hypothetical protein
MLLMLTAVIPLLLAVCRRVLIGNVTYLDPKEVLFTLLLKAKNQIGSIERCKNFVLDSNGERRSNGKRCDRKNGRTHEAY